MKKEKEKTSAVHKFFTALGTVICLILIPVLVINCTLIIKSYTNSDEVPGIGGIFPMIVLSDSMYPEIQSGDLLVCREKDASEIQVGDVIAFYDPAGKGNSIVTHRVAEITKDENGNLAWITKGDANNANDEAIVPADNLVGIYQHRFPGLGKAAMFLQTTKGLIICVVCPLILLAVYDLIRRRIYEKGRKKDTEALLAELESLRAAKERGKQKL